MHSALHWKKLPADREQAFFTSRLDLSVIRLQGKDEVNRD